MTNDTNDVPIKNTAASSSFTESGYAYISLVTWFALLSIIVLNTEIGSLASVLLESESGIPIVFFVICFVNMFYLPYFWIKVIRKMLIYSTIQKPYSRHRHFFVNWFRCCAQTLCIRWCELQEMAHQDGALANCHERFPCGKRQA